MVINKDLLEILRCPESNAPLVLDGDWLVSTDPATRRRYRVEDDIPNMILDEAESMEEQPWVEVMRVHGVIPGGGEQGSCG